MLFSNKKHVVCFPCKLNYIYAYQKVATYCSDNVKKKKKIMFIEALHIEIVGLEICAYGSKKKKKKTNCSCSFY